MPPKHNSLDKRNPQQEKPVVPLSWEPSITSYWLFALRRNGERLISLYVVPTKNQKDMLISEVRAFGLGMSFRGFVA